MRHVRVLDRCGTIGRPAVDRPKRSKRRFPDQARLPGRRAFEVCLVAGLAALVSIRSFGPLRGLATSQVERTVQFSSQLDAIVSRLHADPLRPVVFVSHRPLDYEPVISVQHFLAGRHVTNPLFLRWAGARPERLVGFHQSLARKMDECSANGADNRSSFEAFHPIQSLPTQRRPFGIGFSGDPGRDTESLGWLWSAPGQ